MTDARTTDAIALAFEYGDKLIVGTARDIHRSIAGRAFAPTRWIGGRVPEGIHDAIAMSVYGALSGSMRLTSGTLRALGARGMGRPLEDSLPGRTIRAAVNGLIGDELRMIGDPQAITMSIRVDGTDVPPTPWPLGEAFRGASGHLVVFVHGLCESDEGWHRSRKTEATYAERLAAETDATPVHIRYNTGLHVSENGKHLDALLARTVEAWPTRVSRITLVGHSMGGLVVRAATNHALIGQRTWPGLVRDVVCLGTPHTGAALEKAAHLGSRVLTFWPQSRPLAGILESRSAGILDLRHGYISADEWEGQDLTREWGLDRIAAAPLPHAEYHFVAATLGASRRHVMSSMLGDLLVHFSSASGMGRTGPVVDGAGIEYVPSATHFGLLNHPTIAEWLVAWVNAKSHATTAITTG